MAAKKFKAGLIISIVMLLVGMTAGFLLLGIVYQGPMWVRAAVFIVYLFVAGMTIRVSRRYIRSIDDRTPQ